MVRRLFICIGPLLVAAVLSLPSATVASQEVGDAAAGRDLYTQSCSSCHGIDGAGTANGPAILNAGAASADFMLRTGRMPLADPTMQAVRKPPAFDEQEIADLVAYVASLGSGPGIPEVDPASGELPLGQESFIENCSPCHGATGNGGAVGRGAIAPSLMASQPLDVAEAMVIGPGEMPRFSFEQQEIDSIARYLRYIQTEPDPGGADLGQIGSVPEGFVAWTVGIASIVIVVLIIGRPERGED